MVDELYALSTFGGEEFVSASKLRHDLGDRIHIVWAFSKDFGLSGFRSGVIYTHNEELHRTVDLLAYWAATSGDTQSLLEQMIMDEVWVDEFLAESRRRLATTYRNVTAVFDEAKIPYVAGGSGFFFLLDLRDHLDEPTWEAEDRLWRGLLTEANVNFTPGSACRNAEPGFLRVVFSGLSTEAAIEGAHRAVAWLGARA